MYDQVLFHGTEINRGHRIIKNKKMEISRGDHHWLGDGSYFYEDDFYAYKWIIDMYKKRYKKKPSNSKELFKKYQILKGRVLTDKKRVFNLDKPLHKFEFDRVYEKCKKMLKYSQKFSNIQIADGVILNIMFNDLGYMEYFDIVIATFKRRRNRYKGVGMRLDFIPEKQICVKNIDKVTQIEFYDCLEKIDEFKNYIGNLDKRIIGDNVFMYNRKDKRNKYK